MIMNTDGDLEVFGDEVIKMPMIKEISGELLVECIDEQIKDPTSTKINFLETFKDNYNDDLLDAEGDDDSIKEIKDVVTDFYYNVLEKLNKKYDLCLDEENVFSINGESLQNMTEGLYQFFLIDYQDNVTTYIAKMIIHMKDALADIISKEKKSKDVVSEVMDKKIKSASYAIILANINTAIDLIRELEMDPTNFIELFDEEYFPVAMVKYCIQNNLLNGDFVQSFLKPFFNRIQDDMYDEIMLNIQQKVFEEYKKDFNIEDSKTIEMDDIIAQKEIVNDETEDII